MPELVVDGICKTYEGRVILSDVSFVAGSGETLAVVGPSGSGKSTLLNIIGALEPPARGTVTLSGAEVTALQGRVLAAFRGRAVGFVFQDHHLLPHLTALENVLLPTVPRRPSPADAPARAKALLEELGVGHRAGAFPAAMSGGERQRVAIARALVNRPELLLCDEPTGNLDAETGAQIVALLRHCADTGVIVVMVTHNPEHARQFGRTLALDRGQLVERAAAPARA